MNPPLLKIKLTRNSSKNFKRVLTMIQSCPTYYMNTGNEQTIIHPPIHTVTYNLLNPNERAQALEVGTIVCKWQTCEILLDKFVIMRNQIPLISFCSSNYTDEDYCFCRETRTSPDRYFWGCLLLEHHTSRMRNAWYEYGHLDKDGIFYLHKEDAMSELYQTAMRSGAFLCPFFDFKRVQRVLANLPDDIDVANDPGWDYKYAWQEGCNRRVGVQPVTKISWI